MRFIAWLRIFVRDAMIGLERYFRFAGMALIISCVTILHATGDLDAKRSYAVLRPLRPGAVRPDGWLRVYLQKQADQLGIALPDISEPFNGAYWAGEEHFDAGPKGIIECWWPWEQKGYWIDGSLRCALVLGDEALLNAAENPIKYTLSHPGTNGYLGPSAIANPQPDYFRWPHAVFFRALAAYAEASNDPQVVEAIRRHYLSDLADYGLPRRNVTNIEGMLWAYERCGDSRLLEMAKKAWADNLIHGGEPDHGDMEPGRVLSLSPINSHGVSYIEIAKLPAILYMATGESEYLRYALAAQQRIIERYMLVDGIPSTSEFYSSITSRDVHETCDIADHTWSWGYMLEATGDAIWADRIERACFNAGMGAIKKDWMGIQYLSCPNQMIATTNSSHIPNSGPGTMAYQPNPGSRVACCAGNAHRIFPNYAIRMWMKTDRGVAATLYGASTLRTRLGPQDDEVEIVQSTDYPFEDRIEFTIHLAKSLFFDLSLRIPSWCDAPVLLLNDHSIELPKLTRGFSTLSRSFQPNDKVTLILPMRLKATRWPEGGIALERGPLVYSLPIKESWTSSVVPRWSSAAFPVWSATPHSPWNYGLAIDENRLEAQVSVQRKPMTRDPWIDPPVWLQVPARVIAGWQLAFDPKQPERQFSPPLPNIGGGKGDNFSVAPRDFNPGHSVPVTISVSDDGVPITLVPYGSTHLRVTVFPDLGK